MRKLTVFLLLLVLVLGVATPAFADHGEDVDGLWVATDTADGSLMQMTINELGDSSFRVRFTDFLATQACEPDALFFDASGVGTFDDDSDTFEATFSRPVCAGDSTPTIGPEWTFTGTGVGGGTMIDNFGNVWVNVAG